MRVFLSTVGKGLVALMFVWASVASAAEQPVKVEWRAPEVEVRRFDLKKRPPDMPPLEKNEGAVTRSNFSASTQMRVIVKDQRTSASGACESTVVIERVEMTVALRVTIWLPNNADKKLTAHEQAHRRISEHFYQDAETVAQSLAKSYIGKTLQASGAECDSAVDAAIKNAIAELGGKYMAAIESPASRAQEIFDEITKHGANNVPEDAAIKQAIERAKKEGDLPK